jgi:hypothetical protein
MGQVSFASPKSLFDTYSSGFIGAFCDKRDLDKLMGEMKHPLFSIAADNLAGTGEGKISLPFKCLLRFDPDFGPSERQETGDCVSHATRNAVDVSRAVEICNGEKEDFVLRSATEGIYSSRGFSGEGMTCSQAARFVTTQGGILLRKKYPFADLSKYNPKYGMSLGGKTLPKDMLEEASKHRVVTASLIHTVEAARDAIANGYAISVCSNQGFSNTRDKYGIAAAQGSWAHAMAWIGCDDSREIFNETLFLVQNSWGFWNDGPKRLGQPDGSFWIRQSIAARMLAQDGAFVFSNIDGFEPRKINWDITHDGVF